MTSSLTADERETVITGSDADDHITIWSAQRPIINKLRKNPAAKLLEEGHYGKSAWAKFELPAHMLTFRTKERVGGSGDPNRFSSSQVPKDVEGLPAERT